MFYALIALPVFLLVVWIDLFVRDAGIGQARYWPEMPEGRTLNIRLRGGSIYARLLNIGRSFGAVSIRRTIHAAGELTPSRLAHEVYHILRIAEVGTFRYPWRYLTDGAFREQEELDAELYNLQHSNDQAILSALRIWGDGR